MRELHDYISHLKNQNKNYTPKNSNFVLVPPPAVIFKEQKSRSPFNDTDSVSEQKNKSFLTPLETYTLSSLQFIGTITRDNRTYAYILTPDNKVYSLKKGDTIGTNKGIVKDIRSDRLEVNEPSLIGSDQGVTYKVVVLQLKEYNQ
jgi:Tfp pilus assembly protein PilP